MSRTSGSWVILAFVLLLAWVYTGLQGLSGQGFGNDDLGCKVTSLSEDGGVVPIRAVCDWDVSPERLHQMLAAFGNHARYFAGLAESTVLETDAGITQVRQVHTARGISNRAAVVDWTVTHVDGGTRYTWRKSDDQTAIDGRGLEATECAGSWEIIENGDRTRLIYELRYAPGGSIPFFLLRWFQGAGTRAVLGDFRHSAERHVLVAR